MSDIIDLPPSRLAGELRMLGRTLSEGGESTMAMICNLAAAHLTQATTQDSEPSDWHLVPFEPTAKMKEAADTTYVRNGHIFTMKYQAALLAAPQPRFVTDAQLEAACAQHLITSKE